MNYGAKNSIKVFTIYLTVLSNFVFSAEVPDKCPEFNPQNELDIELISGLWFGAEIITHYEGRAQQVFDSCVILQIEEINEWDDYNYDYDDKYYHKKPQHIDYNQNHYRFIKLQWNELDKSAAYTLKFLGNRRGLWIGTEPPRGSSMKKHMTYSTLVGTVQVMKAVGNHLVLTFCERSELFTIILTRTKAGFAVDDVESVHGLLNRRGLAVVSVRELCRHNYAGRATPNATFVFIVMAILMLWLAKN